MKSNIMKLIPIAIIFILLSPIFIFTSIESYEEGISDYYIDATVLDNGDLHVKELFTLEGDYSGYERIIHFKNINAPKYEGSKDSFRGSDIYNATDIELIAIKGIAGDKITFADLNREGDLFEEVSFANNGEYGVYTVRNLGSGYVYRIYNPSHNQNVNFYIEYILKDIGINHSDISEIGWNIFSDEQQENIKNFQLTMNLPLNENKLQVWGHGALNGTTEIINNQNFELTITDLQKNTAMDVRFVFDHDWMTSTKQTNQEALPYIIDIETELAEIANKEREEALKKEERKEKFGQALNILNIAWLIGLIAFIGYIYKKYDKEYDSNFKTKYYRDFPGSYGPEIVGYLFNKKVTQKELSSSILNLINKKIITYEELKGDNFLLKCDVDAATKNKDLTKSEIKLIKWLFKKVGNGSEVDIFKIRDDAKKNYNLFIGEYEAWKNEVLIEAQAYKFYEDRSEVRSYTVLYSILGIVLFIISLNFPTTTLINIFVIIGSIISIFYFTSITKRSKHGNDDYRKWLGLKRFLNDFGNFKTRDLPEIVLWEKYLVYASVFGIAKKLSNTMKIKINELSSVEVSSPGIDLYTLHMTTRFNLILNNTMVSAYSQAKNSHALGSASSSGGGFGGGFSGGGGSFGGGGGGGRF